VKQTRAIAGTGLRRPALACRRRPALPCSPACAAARVLPLATSGSAILQPVLPRASRAE